MHLSISRIRQVWIFVWVIFTILPYIVMTLRMPGGREQAVTAVCGANMAKARLKSRERDLGLA